MRAYHERGDHGGDQNPCIFEGRIRLPAMDGVMERHGDRPRHDEHQRHTCTMQMKGNNLIKDKLRR